MTPGLPVLVTTVNRGVYFGYLVDDMCPDQVTLTDARCAVSWENMRGHLDLAVRGPNDECRVTPACLNITLYGITGIATCTPEAVAAWEEGPWSG